MKQYVQRRLVYVDDLDCSEYLNMDTFPFDMDNKNAFYPFRATKPNFVKCRNPNCDQGAESKQAKQSFKACHNCDYMYCSRECRRSHWEKHRKLCLHSRVGELCRKLLAYIKQSDELLLLSSKIARKGYLTHGRGLVKYYFSSPQMAEQFCHGYACDVEPAFVRWHDLLPHEVSPALYSELIRICKSYNADTRVVLYVAILAVNEIPTTSAGSTLKWERQIISRCAKTKLSPQLRIANNSLCDLSGSMDTLILTSLPGNQGGTMKDRQISFTNVQSHLRHRGVELRTQFPEVYKNLCAYAEGCADTFTPVTIYPKNSGTGKSFMCIIMPNSDPEKLEFLPANRGAIETIDISKQHTDF